MSASLSTIRLFASDIDDTVLGDGAAAQRFHRAWDALEAARRPLLVYNTGRSIRETQWLVLERRLPRPEFIIGGIGTEISDPVDPHLGADFCREIAAGWDREAVQRIVATIPDVHQQPAEFLNPYKVSWHWHRASAAEVVRLKMQLEQAGLELILSYTGGVFLDIFPRRAGKGNALAWLCRRIGVPLENVLVAGAAANNGSMFTLPGVRGIVVGNASSELFSAAAPAKPVMPLASMADGVLAGLSHFGIVESDRDCVAAPGNN